MEDGEKEMTMQEIESISDKCEKCGSWFQPYKEKIVCRNCGAEAVIVPKHGLKDITGCEYLEVVISADGKVVWVNTEVCCVFRACQIKKLYLDDRRKKK